MDSCQKIGKIQGVGYVHYDAELFNTKQKVTQESSLDLKSVLTQLRTQDESFFSEIYLSKLRYLGIEGHWKVFYEENSLTRFVYSSARPQFVPNCIYEVQLYKSKLLGNLFGDEVVFESKANYN